MKRLAVIFAVFVYSFCFSQKFKLTDTIGHTGDFTKMDSNWNIVKVKDADLILDSLKFEFLQTETIKKLNKIRREFGMPELIVDIRLKPAAIHNANYNRYCMQHKIFQPGHEWEQQGKWTMTHFQRVDIPGHDEILYPDQRIKLLQPNIFSGIAEELTSCITYNNWTYDKISDNIINAYKACSAHWNALTTNTKWNCIYLYIDRKNGICYAILGQYK